MFLGVLKKAHLLNTNKHLKSHLWRTNMYFQVKYQGKHTTRFFKEPAYPPSRFSVSLYKRRSLLFLQSISSATSHQCSCSSPSFCTAEVKYFKGNLIKIPNTKFGFFSFAFPQREGFFIWSVWIFNSHMTRSLEAKVVVLLF